MSLIVSVATLACNLAQFTKMLYGTIIRFCRQKEGRMSQSVQIEWLVDDESTTICVTMSNGADLRLKLPRSLLGGAESIYQADMQLWQYGPPALRNALQELVRIAEEKGTAVGVVP